MDTEISLAPEILSSIEAALAEDIGAGDATSYGIVPSDANLEGRIVTRESGIVAGVSLARTVFELLDKRIRFDSFTNEGQPVEASQTIAEINGPARAILAGERTALNFLGRMSGIATLTRRFVDAVRETKAKILDTRKTAPNLRASDKMAVRLGGGRNHRFGLYDMILIKDNHIDLAGSITEAVKRARRHGPKLDMEVEARTLAEVAESLDLGVTWIMLDNMGLDEMRRAVALAHGRARLEASGNVTLANVLEIAETGVEYISVGALTHSVIALDVSLIVEKSDTRQAAPTLNNC